MPPLPSLPPLSPPLCGYQMKENRVAFICSAYPMRRSDKQPDRVEISPEQLSAAAIEAEVNLVVSRARQSRETSNLGLSRKFWSSENFGLGDCNFQDHNSGDRSIEECGRG